MSQKDRISTSSGIPEEDTIERLVNRIPVLDDESSGAKEFVKKYCDDIFVVEWVLSSMTSPEREFDSFILRSLIFVQDLNKDNDFEKSGFSAVIRLITKDYLSKQYFCSGSTAEGLALIRKEGRSWDFDVDVMYPVKYIQASEKRHYRDITKDGCLKLEVRPLNHWPGYAHILKPNTKDLIYTPDNFLEKIKEIYWNKTSVTACGCRFLLPRNLADSFCYNCEQKNTHSISHTRGKLVTRLKRTYCSGPAITEDLLITNIVNDDSITEKELEIINDKAEGTVITDLSRDYFFSKNFTFSMSVDHVPCIQCPHWPSIAEEFKTRPRPNGWPTREVIRQILYSGVHLVPKPIEAKIHHFNYRGDTKYEHELYLQFTEGRTVWRYSFSMAEKLLSQSLSPIQRRCYLLAKAMIKRTAKDVEEEALNFADCIPGLMGMDRYTTFHLKTVLFWLCEEAPHSFWEEPGIFFCVKTLLKKFLDCITSMKLPNYFAPQHNLFFQMHMGEMIEKAGAVCRTLKAYPMYAGINDMLKADVFDCINYYFPEIMESMKQVINSACIGPYWPSDNTVSFKKWKQQLMCLQLARHFKFLSIFLLNNGNFLGNGHNIALAEYYAMKYQCILDKIRESLLRLLLPKKSSSQVEPLYNILEKNETLTIESIQQLVELLAIFEPVY